MVLLGGLVDMRIIEVHGHRRWRLLTQLFPDGDAPSARECSRLQSVLGSLDDDSYHMPKSVLEAYGEIT